MANNPLAIIPNYATVPGDLELLEECLKSLRESVGDRIDILVVDDASPDQALGIAATKLASRFDGEGIIRLENGGFSKSVNMGLRRALDEGRDAILINADIEIMHRDKPFWLDRMLDQQGLISDGPASVVGGLLAFPEGGLIQHAGIYFSLLTRQFDHLYKYAPMNLPAALKPRTCPVTAALQFIRHDCLEEVGLYDESFPLGYEDVDYCIRVFLAKRECVYQPKVRAWHYESIFRGRRDERLRKRQEQSFWRLMEKYQGQSFAGLVPFL